MIKTTIGDIPVIITGNSESENPKPLLILSHYFSGSKENWGNKADQLTGLGYLVVAMDNRFHGERMEGSFRDKIMSAEGKLNMYQLRLIKKLTADDISLLIDHMIAHYPADQKRIGMIGISMGGFITYAALVTEPRIKAAIPFISSPCWDDIPRDTPVDNTDHDKFVQFIRNFNPAREYHSMYPRYIHMAVGKKDIHFDLEKLQQFYHRLQKLYKNKSDRIELKIYDVAHEVTDEMWNNAFEWLKRTL